MPAPVIIATASAFITNITNRRRRRRRRRRFGIGVMFNQDVNKSNRKQIKTDLCYLFCSSSQRELELLRIDLLLLLYIAPHSRSRFFYLISSTVGCCRVVVVFFVGCLCSTVLVIRSITWCVVWSGMWSSFCCLVFSLRLLTPSLSSIRFDQTLTYHSAQ